MGARGGAGVGGVRGGMSWREARPGGRREAARPRSARPGETLPPGRQRRGAGIGGWSGSGGECWGFPGSWWVPVVEGRTWDTRGTRAGAWVRSPRALTGNLRGDPGAHPLTPSQPPAPLVLTHPQYNPLFQGLLRPGRAGSLPHARGSGETEATWDSGIPEPCRAPWTSGVAPDPCPTLPSSPDRAGPGGGVEGSVCSGRYYYCCLVVEIVRGPDWEGLGRKSTWAPGGVYYCYWEELLPTPSLSHCPQPCQALGHI